tara:strand:+ start:121 stop:582 length:462 start_codon:yes stop_codon:yes gene_type:complete
MGNKRVGLARTQALIQNLKRELTMQGSSLAGIERVTKSITSTGALTADDSGKIITLTGSAFTLSLPAVAASAGCYFYVVAGAAENYVISETASSDTDVLTMVSVNASGGGAVERDHAFTTATLVGAIGDRFHIYSNGTNWVITAFANAAVAAA